FRRIDPEMIAVPKCELLGIRCLKKDSTDSSDSFHKSVYLRGANLGENRKIPRRTKSSRGGEWQKFGRSARPESIMDKLRPIIAEFIGTFALIFVGIGAIYHMGQLTNNAGLLTIALAHGLTIAVMVSATAHI